MGRWWGLERIETAWVVAGLSGMLGTGCFTAAGAGIGATLPVYRTVDLRHSGDLRRGQPVHVTLVPGTGVTRCTVAPPLSCDWVFPVVHVEGIFDAFASDQLWILGEGDAEGHVTGVALSTLHQVEVEDGSHWVVGGLMGAVVDLAAIAILLPKLEGFPGGDAQR